MVAIINRDANTCNLEKHYKKYFDVVFFLDAVNNLYKKYYILPDLKKTFFFGIGIWRKKCVNYDKIKIAQHCVLRSVVQF